MILLKGLITAFSMFSKIPMPSIEWGEKNMKYMFIFFPIIGVVIGVITILWFLVCQRFGINNIAFAAIATIIPPIVTGGIHIDGFMDTCDALASHKDREDMLDIMSDSRVGAFAVVGVVFYYILFFAAMTCISELWQVCMTAVAMFAVRAIASLSIISSEPAKQTGLIFTFKNATDSTVTGLFSVVYILLSAGAMESLNLLSGIAVVIVLIVVTAYFKFFTVKKFGGITGDLVGWFVSISELAAVIAAAAGTVFS